MTNSNGNLRGKLRIAALGAVVTVTTAAISAAVSWLVSDQTLKLDRWRAQAENSVQRAEIFKDLMEHVTTQGKAGYAILALWKLYENDRKLVVISALQSKDPQALTVLHQLGLERELVGYERTIRNLIDKVGGDRRRELLQLYSEIDPSGLIDLSVERVLDDPPTTFSQSEAFNELAGLLKNRPEFRTQVVERISSDTRVQESVRSRFALALALYLAGQTEPFDRMIVDSKSDIDFFGSLAPLINAGWQKVRYEVRDQETLLFLSVDLMEASSGKENKEGQFYDALEIFRNAFPQSGVASSERPKIVKMFEDHFRIIPHDRLTRERILHTVWNLDQESAIKLYYYAVACEDVAQSRQFFHTVDVSNSLFAGEKEASYQTTREQGLKNLKSRDLTCETWRTL